MKKLSIFVVLLGLSSNFGCAEDDRIVVASESSDIIKLEYSHFIWPDATVFLSKTKFAQFMVSKVSSVESVFNIRKIDGFLSSDSIAFSATINGSTYHDIECDINTIGEGTMIVFEDCGSDVVRFQYTEIWANDSDVLGAQIVAQ